MTPLRPRATAFSSTTTLKTLGLLLVALTALLLLAGPQPGAAQAPGPYTFFLPAVVGPYEQIKLQPFATGLDQPTAIANTGDERLFVAERPGRVRLIDAGGTVAATTFLDIHERVESAVNWEQGLLGLAFHPDYATNGLFFVAYTAAGTGDPFAPLRLSRFQTDPQDPGRALPESEVILLTIPQAGGVHHGGDLHFGPLDGYLYMSTGESSAPPTAQDLGDLRGSLLRLDVSTAVDPIPAPAYTVPPSNPFVGRDGARGEIWALGLRNPWRFSFDAAGNLYVADVGQNSWEEVNIQPHGSLGGENYGWPCMEGPASGTTPYPCLPDSPLTAPVWAYDHTFDRCSITGGRVYEGAEFPAARDIYFFADLCAGTFWGLPSSGLEPAREFGRFPGLWPAAFGANAAGELFVAAHVPGVIYHVILAGDLPVPAAARSPRQGPGQWTAR